MVRPELKLTITLAPDGSVQVTGPADDPFLCYGLLGLARDAISNHAMLKQQRIIAPIALTNPITPR